MVVTVALAVADILHQFGRCVEDVGGRHQAAGFLGALPGRLHRGVGGVRFGRGGEVEAGLHQRQFALGAAEEFVGVLGRHAHRQRLRIGEADVLHRHADEAAGEEARFLPGGQHSREIIERRLRIGAAHSLVERGNEVVVPLAILVVNRHPALEKRAEPGRVEWLGQLRVVERLRLIE